MAVKEGFEPSIRDKPYTPLAGERLQPLGHLTVFCSALRYGALERIRTSDRLVRSQVLYPAELRARNIFFNLPFHLQKRKSIVKRFARMAVKEGFEPSIRDKPYTPLAGERLQPLGHLTVLRRHILRFTKNKSNIFFEKIAQYRSSVAYLINTCD